MASSLSEGLTSQLYKELTNTFLDDKRLEQVEESQVALLVFSKNYATLSWCLVKIMECKEKNRQTVILIFYHVDPPQVRYFAEAFAKHELRFKDDVEGMQKVQGWRIALTAAAALKGYHIGNGIGSDCIQDIVDQVSSILCKRLKELSCFTRMENLDTSNMSYCNLIDGGLPEDIGSLSSLKKLNLGGNKYLPQSIAQLGAPRSLKLSNYHSGIRVIPSSIILPQWSHLTELYLIGMHNLVSLPSSICELKVLVKLHVFQCSKLESLPEGIGDLERLELLDASYTLISRPPSSIVRLNKLKVLTFAKEESEDTAYFVFPQVNEGLVSLEVLDLSYCNLIDGGLPEDIGSLSSLKKLKLVGNNFEYLPQSIAELGALQILHLPDCKRLAQLPEFPQQLDIIDADWSSDSTCKSLFQNMSSLQHDISASDSSSLRVVTSWSWSIPSWFHRLRLRDTSVSVDLPENWYVSNNFLGFAVCYPGRSNNDMTAHLIPLCGDGASPMTKKFALSKRPFGDPLFGINFFVIPLAVLWDASKANGKTPNDYRYFSLFSIGEPDGFWFGRKNEVGVRLLYKDELEIGMKRSRDEEGSCSSN